MTAFDAAQADEAAAAPVSDAGSRDYRKGSVLADWLSSTDHKIIGHLYLITAFSFFLDSLRVALRWEATGITAGLFPVLDGDFTLAPADRQTTRLALAGVYRAPLGRLGAALDTLVLHKVAEATARSLLRSVADALTNSSESV